MSSEPGDLRVLVLAPTGRDGALAARALAEAGLDAQSCRDVPHLCEELRRGAGLLVIAEESLAPAAIQELVGVLRDQPPWSDIPIVVPTSGGDAAEGSTRTLRVIAPLASFANVSLLERPLRMITLVSAVQVGLRARRRQYEVRAHVVELRRIERQLAELNQELNRRVEERTKRLQESNDQLEAFSYSVSHNLRAPIRAMEGYAEAILEDCGPGLGPLGTEYAGRLIAACRRMDAIIQDMLAYGRVTRTEVITQPLSLAGAVRETLASLDTLFAERRATVVNEIEDSFPHVVGHRAMLGEAITNLFTNAVKFVRPGERPFLRVWAEARDGLARLWVEDRGIGIAPQFHQRIFEAFERLHRDEVYPGTGVGLAMVKKTVERMNGRVDVESELGHGSRFWIELPVAQLEDSPDDGALWTEPEPRSIESSDAAPAVPGKGRRPLADSGGAVPESGSAPRDVAPAH